MTMRERKVQMPKLQRRAEVDAAAYDAEKRTFPFTFSTGAKVLRYDWNSGSYYYEELSMDPKHIRLDFFNSGNAPMLNTHRRYDLSDVLGVIEPGSIDVKDGVGRGVGRFSRRSDVEPIVQDVADKIIRNGSIGYKVSRFEVQPRAEGESIPTWLATDWSPVEFSPCPLGADDGAGFRSDGVCAEPPKEVERNECLVINNIASERGEEDSDMDVNVKKDNEAAPAPQQVNLDQERSAAAEAERTRAKEIRTLCRSVGVAEQFADKLVEGGVKLEDAQRQIIAEVARSKDSGEIRASVSIEAGAQDESLTRRQGMESALLHRANPKTHELSEQGRRFRSMSLLRMAEEIVGVRNAAGMTKSQIVARAMSTADFALTLANVAGKSLRSGYKLAPQTFWPFVRQGTLPDYKQVSRIQFGDVSSLKAVSEGGEYEFSSIGEGAEKIQLAKYGRLVRVTEELIVNDDLDALSRIPAGMGAAGSRLESKLVYDILANNAAMADTVALFHATHGNLAGSGGAINATTVAAGDAAIRNQKTLDGEDFLGVAPKYLICGTAKRIEALQLLNAVIVAAKSSDTNPFKGAMEAIVDPRVSGNTWFLACDPNEIDTIEIAYLEGMAGPEMDSETEFNSDCVKMKIKHVVGTKAIDYRGLYKNPGA
jgi:hypothetical protein